MLIVAEAMHATAASDVLDLVDTLVADVAALWGSPALRTMLTSTAPRFEWDAWTARQ